MSLRIIFALLKKWRLGSLTAILDSSEEQMEFFLLNEIGITIKNFK